MNVKCKILFIFSKGGLLQPNPDDRWNFELILSHLTSFNITKLEFKKPVAVPIQETARREEKSLFSSLRG